MPLRPKGNNSDRAVHSLLDKVDVVFNRIGQIFVSIITLLGENRSASAPPTRMKSARGIAAVAITVPRVKALSVSWITSQGKAIMEKASPTIEISEPAQSNRKFLDFRITSRSLRPSLSGSCIDSLMSKISY